MVSVDMDALQLYRPPAKAGLHSDERPTTSNLRVPARRWEGKDSAALGASQDSSGVLHNPNLIKPQNLTGPLQKDSLDSFRAPGLGLNDSKADKKTANIPSERVNTNWDDMIPLSCQSVGDRLHRFRYPPGATCKAGALGKPTAGKTVCDPIEVDSADDSSSSDDSGSNIGHETSSATTPTCAISPGISSSDEDKIKNTVTGGGGAEGPVTVALNLQEHQDSSWLVVDQFPDSDLRFEDRAAEYKCQKLGNREDSLRSDGAKDGQAEDRFREIDHHANLAGNGPEDEDGVEHGREDAITDPEMDGIEVYGDGSHSTGGHRAGVGGDAEGEQNPSDAEVPQAPVHSSHPPIARRGRGRPRRSRTAITVGNAVWEITKIAGDELSGEGRVLKVQAEVWLAEEDLPVLRGAIARYRAKQGRTRGKRKNIYGRKRRSARGKREECQAST